MLFSFDSDYKVTKTIPVDRNPALRYNFISHRLSTTRMADKIYMFDGGEIVESGSHDELILLNGKYAEMYRVQAKKYKNAI